MKNASSLKSKPETPKTPGGISKSLLTPCRRIGLSRNWRKSVASPFNSPLANSEAKADTVETRKRKVSLQDTPTNIENYEKHDSVGTPTKKVDVGLPRRKKSKTLLNSITKTAEDDCSQPETPPKNNNEKSDKERFSKDVETAKTKASNLVSTPKLPEFTSKERCKEEDIVLGVSTPVRLKSLCKKKITKSTKESRKNKKDDTYISKNEVVDIEEENLENSTKLENKLAEKTEMDTVKQNPNIVEDKKKENSPNNLTRECIVLIQKKIFKNQINEFSVKDKSDNQQTSQTLFNDSDSDDVPLDCLNKGKNGSVKIITIDEDDDFATSKYTQNKIAAKNSSEKPSTTTKTPKESTKTRINVKAHNQPSQSSIDDDDEFCKKRTIVVRKTYDKVIKPLKARSTGSITQKDIEDLKARIETKKKMLLAKSMTDTKELRELIKKWQKGCQDALMELMDLMKIKCPEQNMEYSQILQTLKIPPNLVGYDSDNDCFVTPEDENIILSHIKE